MVDNRYKLLKLDVQCSTVSSASARSAQRHSLSRLQNNVSSASERPSDRIPSHLEDQSRQGMTKVGRSSYKVNIIFVRSKYVH